MDNHALDYYRSYSEESPNSRFHAVIALHDNEGLSWEDLSKIAPSLSRGWYELSQLSKEDRLDFTREFWLSKLSYHSGLVEFISKFFASLDDIGVFLTQLKYDDPFEAQLVYSRADNSGFFHGGIPASEEETSSLQKMFPDYMFPTDYIAFLQIHNGFAKLTDTGILKIGDMEVTYQGFQEMLAQENPLVTSSGQAVNPKSLIPFYKSFSMPFFQCFWGEWYPSHEMGNVYYSNITKTISDCSKADFRVETMAFETFVDWLIFYLETIE